MIMKFGILKMVWRMGNQSIPDSAFHAMQSKGSRRGTRPPFSKKTPLLKSPDTDMHVLP